MNQFVGTCNIRERKESMDDFVEWKPVGFVAPPGNYFYKIKVEKILLKAISQ